MSAEPLTLNENGLYILLFDLGGGYRFNWQLYLATSTESGTIFHLINPGHSDASWQFEAKPSNDERRSPSLVLATQIALLDPILHQALQSRLSSISMTYSVRFRENISRRVWVKEALYTLDNEGYITLTNTVDCIEKEVTTTAMINKYYQRRTVMRSSWSSWSSG